MRRHLSTSCEAMDLQNEKEVVWAGAKRRHKNGLAIGHSISQSKEPLPPYELDPMLDDPVIRNRIGEMIARAAKKRICKI